MKKQLTQADKKQLKKAVQKSQLPDGTVLAYCIVNKDSKLGFSSNERLMLMHGGQKSIRYYSKLPLGLPFSRPEQVIEGKEKVYFEKVTDFDIHPLKGKSSTIQMTWQNGKEKVVWIYAFGSSKMMYQWLAAVDQIRHNKLKLDNVPKEPTKVATSSQKQQSVASQPPPLNPHQEKLYRESQMKNPTKFGDVAEQIKYLRQSDYPRFILSDELEGKNPNQSQPTNQTNSNNQIPKQNPPLDNAKNPTNLQNNPPPQSNPEKKPIYQSKNPVQANPSTKPSNQNKPPQNNDSQPRGTEPISENPKKVSSQKPTSDQKNSQSHPPPENYSKPSPKNNQNPPPPKVSSQKMQAIPEEQYLPRKTQPRANDVFSSNNQYPQEDNNFLLPTRKPKENPSNYSGSGNNSRVNQMDDNPTSKNSAIQNKRPYNQPPQIEEERRFKPRLNKPLGVSKQWNQMWFNSKDPQEFYEEFLEETLNVGQKIIDELPMRTSDKQYSPVKVSPPHFIYIENGIQYNLHYFVQGKNILDDSLNSDKAPILYDHESFEESKREFYNFNFLMSSTGNRSIFKVPLSCYFHYKGILAVCKALTPQRFEKIEPYQLEKQLQDLQQTIKVRFIFQSMTLFRHPSGKYVLFGSLEELIPRIPNNLHPPAYFRTELMLQNQVMIDDKNSISSLNNKLLNSIIPDFVNQLETLQNWVICSSDFRSALHKVGISLGCLTDLYEHTNFMYLKKIIISEMVCETFQQILRSQLNNAFQSFPVDEFDEINTEIIDSILLECLHIMINELFSYSIRSQDIWRAIVMHIKKKYHIVISKEDVLPGYLLGGITDRFGIRCQFKDERFNRENTLFVKENCIPKGLIVKLIPKMRRYDISLLSNELERVNEILDTPQSPQNFEDLVHILRLKQSDIPPYLQPRKEQILLYLCNFVPLGEHDDFQHLGLYDILQTEPHTYITTKASLLGIKWSIKRKNQELANRIFELKFEENAFWAGQFNPAITQFYDFFALYNASIGNNDEAIKLAKSSLINVIKLFGTNALPTADKHYQLGNIFFKVSRKQDALKEYIRTKQILESHNQTGIPEYGVILLKLSILYLNFGKISDCVGSALQALKIFDSNGGSEDDEIETFQILARAYEITRKNADMISVGALCMQKFNNSENIKNFQRMIKIVVLPKLATVNSQDNKKLLKVFDRLEELDTKITSLEAFTYLHYKAEQEIVLKKILIFIDNIHELYDDVMRRDLFRFHRSLDYQPELQAAQMLIYFEAIAKIVGFSFLVGSLKQNYV